MFRDGGTFSHQANLPRLPIPTLKHTAEVYLKSLKPILNEDEYNATEGCVNDFFLKPNGLGEVLQQRLIEYDKTQKYSWIEKWWFEKVYWEWREPLMVNSNWYILFVDDSNQPSELVTQNGGRLPRGGFGKFQISRAAHLINRSLDYKALLDEERLPVDKTKSGYLDMDQYTKIFGVTRIPLEGCDTMVNAHPHTSKHIIVLVRDQIYTVDVYDTSGKRVPDGNIEKQLQTVVEDVQRSNNQMYPPICLLTADNRDEWAKVHKRLCRLDPTNRDTFNVIEDALFAVSLDDYSSGRLPDQQVRNVLLTPDGHNRWFDKSVSIIVESNGKAGMNGEHSPCDALIPSIYAEYILKDATDVNAVHSRYDATARVATPRRLKFVIDSNIEESLRQAQARVQKTIDDSDACVLQFEDYGIGFIKKSAQVSPDAYMQMALQLGYFKLHKKCVPTYETASTRRFLHGRTETTRTLSCESKKWVEAMERSDVDSTFKYTLLREAVDAHINFATMAGNGQGCDRHMLGLRLVMKPGESHNVFTNSAFSRSQKWQLSTSGLSAGDYFNGTGFGTVYPDGYGINYLTGENILKFGIESKRSCAETSSTNFRNAVVQALRDMQKITLEAGPGGKAKL